MSKENKPFELNSPSIAQLLPSSRQAESLCLMPLVCQGDRDAFNRLYQYFHFALSRYFQRRISCQATINDLIQEVFSRVWEKRQSYQAGTPDLAYLKGYARNVLREYQSKQCTYVHKLADCAVNPTVIEHDQMLEHCLEKKETISELQLFIKRLPKKQRQALELVFLEGMSSREAAVAQRCSDKTIRVNCHLSLLKLKAWMGEHDEE